MYIASSILKIAYFCGPQIAQFVEHDIDNLRVTSSSTYRNEPLVHPAVKWVHGI